MDGTVHFKECYVDMQFLNPGPYLYNFTLDVMRDLGKKLKSPAIIRAMTGFLNLEKPKIPISYIPKSQIQRIITGSKKLRKYTNLEELCIEQYQHIYDSAMLERKIQGNAKYIINRLTDDEFRQSDLFKSIWINARGLYDEVESFVFRWDEFMKIRRLKDLQNPQNDNDAVMGQQLQTIENGVVNTEQLNEESTTYHESESAMLERNSSPNEEETDKDTDRTPNFEEVLSQIDRNCKNFEEFVQYTNVAELAAKRLNNLNNKKCTSLFKQLTGIIIHNTWKQIQAARDNGEVTQTNRTSVLRQFTLDRITSRNSKIFNTSTNMMLHAKIDKPIVPFTYLTGVQNIFPDLYTFVKYTNVIRLLKQNHGLNIETIIKNMQKWYNALQENSQTLNAKFSRLKVNAKYLFVLQYEESTVNHNVGTLLEEEIYRHFDVPSFISYIQPALPEGVPSRSTDVPDKKFVPHKPLHVLRNQSSIDILSDKSFSASLNQMDYRENIEITFSGESVSTSPNITMDYPENIQITESDKEHHLNTRKDLRTSFGSETELIKNREIINKLPNATQLTVETLQDIVVGTVATPSTTLTASPNMMHCRENIEITISGESVSTSPNITMDDRENIQINESDKEPHINTRENLRTSFGSETNLIKNRDIINKLPNATQLPKETLQDIAVGTVATPSTTLTASPNMIHCRENIEITISGESVSTSPNITMDYRENTQITQSDKEPRLNTREDLRTSFGSKTDLIKNREVINKLPNAAQLTMETLQDIVVGTITTPSTTLTQVHSALDGLQIHPTVEHNDVQTTIEHNEILPRYSNSSPSIQNRNNHAIFQDQSSSPIYIPETVTTSLSESPKQEYSQVTCEQATFRKPLDTVLAQNMNDEQRNMAVIPINQDEPITIFNYGNKSSCDIPNIQNESMAKHYGDNFHNVLDLLIQEIKVQNDFACLSKSYLKDIVTSKFKSYINTIFVTQQLSETNTSQLNSKPQNNGDHDDVDLNATEIGSEIEVDIKTESEPQYSPYSQDVEIIPNVSEVLEVEDSMTISQLLASDDEELLPIPKQKRNECDEVLKELKLNDSVNADSGLLQRKNAVLNKSNEVQHGAVDPMISQNLELSYNDLIEHPNVTENKRGKRKRKAETHEKAIINGHKFKPVDLRKGANSSIQNQHLTTASQLLNSQISLFLDSQLSTSNQTPSKKSKSLLPSTSIEISVKERPAKLIMDYNIVIIPLHIFKLINVNFLKKFYIQNRNKYIFSQNIYGNEDRLSAILFAKHDRFTIRNQHLYKILNLNKRQTSALGTLLNIYESYEYKLITNYNCDVSLLILHLYFRTLPGISQNAIILNVGSKEVENMFDRAEYLNYKYDLNGFNSTKLKGLYDSVME